MVYLSKPYDHQQSLPSQLMCISPLLLDMNFQNRRTEQSHISSPLNGLEFYKITFLA